MDIYYSKCKTVEYFLQEVYFTKEPRKILYTVPCVPFGYASIMFIIRKESYTKPVKIESPEKFIEEHFLNLL